MKHRVIRLLVALYPRHWRDRYAEEFAALLEARPLGALDVVDVAVAALDARVSAYLAPGPAPLGADAARALRRLRAGSLTVLVGYVACILSGLAFYGMVDDSPFVPLMRQDLPLRLAWLSVETGAALALLAVAIGGLPIALSVLRQAAAGRRDLRLLVAVPFGTSAVVGIGALAVTLIANGVLPGPDVLPAHRLAVVSGMSGLLVLAAALSTAAAALAVLRADLSPRAIPWSGAPAAAHPFVLAAPASLLGTACMAAMLVATVAWGLLARSALPDAFDSGYAGVGVTPLHSWLAIVAAMAVAAAIALVGTLRTLSARPGTPTTA